MNEPVPAVIVPGFYGYVCEDDELSEDITPSSLLLSLWLGLLEGSEDDGDSFTPGGILGQAKNPLATTTPSKHFD